MVPRRDGEEQVEEEKESGAGSERFPTALHGGKQWGEDEQVRGVGGGGYYASSPRLLCSFFVVGSRVRNTVRLASLTYTTFVLLGSVSSGGRCRACDVQEVFLVIP